MTQKANLERCKLFNINDVVKDKVTNSFGKILDREWENGWTYTIHLDNDRYIYRDEDEIERA